VVIDGIIDEMWQFNDFQNGDRPPSYIFKILKLKRSFIGLRLKRVNICQRDKFRGAQFNHCRDVAVYRFFQYGDLLPC